MDFMSQLTLDTQSQDYLSRLFPHMISGVIYHLPLAEAAGMTLARRQNFTTAYREVSRTDAGVAQVRQLTSRGALRRVTQSVADDAKLFLFLDSIPEADRR
jgi:hypothetical protein